MVYCLLGLLVYLNQRYLFQKSLNNLDCVRFIGVFGLFFNVYFSMRSLNKPNKPVYFSMHSLTGYQESVRFIGLFGLLVYFTMHTFTGEWDCVRFIRREVRHHRKHMLDDPPNMIDPINYVLLFSSIHLFKSFHVAICSHLYSGSPR